MPAHFSGNGFKKISFLSSLCGYKYWILQKIQLSTRKMFPSTLLLHIAPFSISGSAG